MAAPSANPESATLPRRLAAWAVARASNLYWIDDGRLARSAQLYGRHVGLVLDAYGFRTVLNLRGENPKADWYRDEASACAAHGVAYRDVPLNSRRLPRRAELLALLEAFDAMDAPALVKCSGGADRTGLAAFLYILDREGPGAYGKAARQLSAVPYLHIPKPQQRWMKRFLEYWRASGGPDMPVRRWLAEVYDAQTFAAWLDARGLRKTYRNV
jgi:protein tyrosine phosphatase (PTP) superfamily phosphohydrolase (DUF442 family)